MLTRRTLILAKVESSFGVDPTPAAANDAFLVADVNYTLDVQQNERNIYTSSLSKEPTVPGRKIANLTFSHELKGSGVAGTAPKIGVLLRGCGFAETDLGSSDGFEYDPVSGSFTSLTFYIYMDGVLHKMTGSRGSVSFQGEAGGYGQANFTFQGNYVAPTDVAFPASPVFEATLPPIIELAAMALHGYGSFCAQSFNIDIANTLAPNICMNAAEGFNGIDITDRVVTGGVNPESVLVATFDAFGRFKDGTEGAFTITIGTADDNKCVITAPKTQFTNVGYSDRDGKRVWDLAVKMNRNTGGGNDEVKIAFPQSGV